jgi:hypothetical protein
MVNARSCLLVALEAARPARVWLPSFLCPLLVDVCRVAGVDHRFYEVDEDLVAVAPSGLPLRQDDMIVVIHYFGFPNPMAAALAAEGRVGWIVEDASHAWLTDGLGRHGQFLITSPRKFLGVPDGGILASTLDVRSLTGDLDPPPDDWWRISLTLALSRRDFDHGADDTEWFGLRRPSADGQPIGHHRMSDLARTIISGADLQAIRERRRANYRYLAERLPEIAIWPQLPDEVTPVGFPVRLRERDRVRMALYEEGIHAQVQWKTADVHTGIPASEELSRRILTLCCDQRYSEQDMGRTVEVIRAAIARDGRGPDAPLGDHGQPIEPGIRA